MVGASTTALHLKRALLTLLEKGERVDSLLVGPVLEMFIKRARLKWLRLRKEVTR